MAVLQDEYREPNELTYMLLPHLRKADELHNKRLWIKENFDYYADRDYYRHKASDVWFTATYLHEAPRELVERGIERHTAQNVRRATLRKMLYGWLTKE